jgi:hypothetical protein
MCRPHSSPPTPPLYLPFNHSMPQAYGEACTVVLLDNRGIGKSSAPHGKGAYSTAIMAQDALAVMVRTGATNTSGLCHLPPRPGRCSPSGPALAPTCVHMHVYVCACVCVYARVYAGVSA